MAEFFEGEKLDDFIWISPKRGGFKKSAGESGENQPEGRVYGSLRPHQADPKVQSHFFEEFRGRFLDKGRKTMAVLLVFFLGGSVIFDPFKD